LKYKVLKTASPFFFWVHEATSPTIRKLLNENPKFTELLTQLDQLRGQERESALQQVLGTTSPGSSSSTATGFGRNTSGRTNSLDYTEEHTKLLRSLTEAVDAIVRGGKSDALGLEWGEME
jgi:zinc finger HIT domain-containing protein 3